MLTRIERIAEASNQLHTEKAKQMFLKLADQNPEMSVFWDSEDGLAVLEDEELRIEIS